MLNINFQKDYDIVVVGLGTAGAIALITAAKLGLKVLGIERLSAMGGTGTLGAIGSYYFGSTGGLYETVNQQVQALQQAQFTPSDFPKFDVKAYMLEQTAAANNAHIIYEAVVTDVHMEEKNVVGLRYFHKDTFTDIFSKFIIDCTGEADICTLCGCETGIGRQYDRQTQPFSNIVIVVNENGKACGLNRDSGYVDQNNAEDLSRSIVKSLTLPSCLQEDYQHTPDIVTTASLLGIREGRTITGESKVTLDGFFNGESAQEPIFYAYANIDNHGKDTAFEDAILKDWYVCAGLWGVNFSIGVPLGALIPKGFHGILAAGRCISVDHNIAPCIRMKSDMEKCGEAAASIAFLAILNKAKAMDVSYPELSKMLKATGCLDEANHVGFINKMKDGLVPFHWITDIDTLQASLSGNSPGIGIWSAKLLGNKVIEPLTNWLNSENTNLQKHSAIALGLLDNEKALPILRQMAEQLDPAIPNSCIKYVYTLGTSAIYLLGKLKDVDSLPLLYNIVKTRGAFDENNFTPDELHATPNGLRFQHLTYAVGALVEIRNTISKTRAEIDHFLTKNILECDEKFEITLKFNPYSPYDMYPQIKAYVKVNILP